jgi:hypothetical protein
VRSRNHLAGDNALPCRHDVWNLDMGSWGTSILGSIFDTVNLVYLFASRAFRWRTRPAGLRPITRSVDWVEVGCSQTIRERSENACFAAQMKRTVEPGEVDVLVGANSTEASAVQVTVVP